MSDRILLTHGSGGKLARNLVEKTFLKAFFNPILAKMDDAAVFSLRDSLGSRVAFTTDSYVVSPLFFPGGDIGRLAVCGTVNDLSMSGAKPLYLSLAFIIEEGFPCRDLKVILESITEAASEAEVTIVTGDTKVVNRGCADRLFINTAGIGVIPEGVDISGANARPGSKVIVSGTIGDHGIAVMSKREGLTFNTELQSDCAPLNSLVAEMLKVTHNIYCLRDPTRGGLATTLNELARQSQVGIEIEEENIPIREEVWAACELFGLDPLYVACEGRLLAIVPPEFADELLAAMRQHKYGKSAAIIGEVNMAHPGRVVLKTTIGSSRILDMLTGEQLPRIC